MSQPSSSIRSQITLSRVLRYGGFAILLGMLILSLVYQYTNPPTDAEAIEATVQAGVNQGLTEVAQQTGTPEATALQSTVDARIDATLTAIVISSATPTPDPDRTPTEEAVDNTVGFFETLLAPILNILASMWNFAGLGGVWLQVCCCIVPPIAIVVGIIND
ncbi:MAG: hypothetical protein AAFV98_18080 [Chloroflexota bacterium]